MIYFTADEHYEHDNVIKFCHRPFNDIDDMRDELIRRNNSFVKSGDLVYHLGDMFWRTCSEDQALGIMSRLNGNHYYINGNHEELMRKSKKLQSRFVWCRDIAKIASTETTPRIVLCHYAMLVWEGSHRGDWQLYGHSHGELSKNIPDHGTASRLNSFDIGVDCTGYYPLSLDKVHVRMTDKQSRNGYTWHVCPGCQHKFSNYSQDVTICTKCLTDMTTNELIQKIKEQREDSGV